MRRKGSFKNIKLGKNVHRQIKRRGAPDYARSQKRTDRGQKGKPAS
jgi:hypothetical protein